MPSILITQCLQRDFVEPVEAHEPLPNRLHVGHQEALRLIGHDPLAGPVAQVLRWARQQPAEELAILHVRDWHDATDQHQHDHLEMFGPHCLAGTPGAAVVLGFDRGVGGRPDEHFVDAVALNDFEGTTLPRHLERIRQQAGGAPIRIGVIGVWTEAKVSFLLYDLKTRGHFDELATCSALTASASRAQHFNALDQLRKILGVRVFDSPGEFAEWLVPASAGQVGRGCRPIFRPQLEVVGGQAPLAEADVEVLGFLFRDSARVDLEALSGGYSGALVFRAAATDALGQSQAPSVAKVGPRSLIGTERAAFERVEAVLGNRAPTIRGFTDLGDRAGIKYSYASMGKGPVRTFQSLYTSGRADGARVEEILREVFEEILHPFYSAALYEPLPLLEHYTFSPTAAGHVRRMVRAVHGPGGDAPALTLADGSAVSNVAGFYEDHVPRRLGRIGEFHYVSSVHGDLNGANILVDSRENVWLIDFFHTARGHVLKDLIKLENDLLCIFTPLASEEELVEALHLSRALIAVEDLRAPLPDCPAAVSTPALRRAWDTVRVLRSIGAGYVKHDRNPEQVLVGMVRYAVQTLGFTESDARQKRWALATACLAAERLTSASDRNRTLRIAFLDAARLGGPGRLGLVLCPGRRDHGRDLEQDLAVIAQEGIRHIFGLVTQDELEWAGVPHIAQAVGDLAIAYCHHPVPDQGVPTLEEARAISAAIRRALERGENVLVHCIGGLGRTGTLAACVAIDRGLAATDAIQLVRCARGPRAIESAAQEAFVRAYHAAGERSDSRT